MFKNAVKIFDIFGFKIKIDPSWLLIAALIVWSLSTSYFPENLAGLTRGEYIALSVIAMLGLFASLIVHELSHSIVARRFNLKVGGITLFLFGGVAELEQEPQDAVSEFWIAIAGPIASLAVAGLAYLLVRLQGADQEAHALTEVVKYLGLMNLVLALFNLVPAFPLDGGRILRAALWKYKGDLFWSTKLASDLGVIFGVLLIILGALSIFYSSGVAGFWQILVGFFIMSASTGSYQQLIISATLKNFQVNKLMSKNIISAEASDTLEYLVENIMLQQNVSFVPVVDGDHLLGYIDMKIVQKIDKENWQSTHLDDVYVPSDTSNTVSQNMPTDKLFELMAKTGRRKLLIADNGKLSGVISFSDLMTFLSIRQGLGTPVISNTHKI